MSQAYAHAAQTVFVFPGQGSQHVGMVGEFMTYPATRELFELADDTLGFHLSKLMREGDVDTLTLTHNAQPALLLAGMVVFSYIQKQLKTPTAQLCAAMAGHSVGEYTAATAAGCLSLAEGLKLVRLRGEVMTKAVPAGSGAMAAILGLGSVEISPVCRSTGCAVANDNAEGQVVISGTQAAVDEASNLLAMQGAKKVIRLNVAGPFHTAAMQPAADAVAAQLAVLNFQTPQVPLIMNATAAFTDTAEDVAMNLVEQITGTVHWRESMQAAAAKGLTQVVECGAGKVLAGLAKRCDSSLQATALNTPQQVDEWLESQLSSAA